MKKNKEKSPSVSKKKTEKKRAPKKANTGYFLVPFLIMIISLVIESCLVFNQKTGFVGMWVYNIFTGLFGSAAYFIPAGALVIAFFFNSISENKMIGFKSGMLMLFSSFLASLNSAVSIDDLGSVPVNVVDYFTKGYSGEGGGVIGGLVGKLMNAALGSVFSIIISVIVCILTLTLFLGTTKTGIWFYLKELRMFGAEKTATPKLPKKAPEKISSKETASGSVEPRSVETTQPLQQSGGFNRAESVPSFFGGASGDPFHYGSEVGTRKTKISNSMIDLRTPETKAPEVIDIYSEENEEPKEEVDIKISQPAVRFGSQNGRAYSPFADPFIKREEFIKNGGRSEARAPEISTAPSRAYSPFADPLINREDFMRQGKPAEGNGYSQASVSFQPPQIHSVNNSSQQSPYVGQSGSAAQQSAYAGQFNSVTQNSTTDRIVEKSEESRITVESIVPERTVDIPKKTESTEKLAPWDVAIKNATPLNVPIPTSSINADDYSEDVDDEEYESDEEEGYVKKESLPNFSTGSFASAYADKYNMEKSNAEQSFKEESGAGFYKDHSEKFYPNYVYPSSVLLEQRPLETTVTEDDVIEVRNKLLGKLASFRIEASLVGYSAGPSVTRYEIAPGPGVTVKAITNRIEDISLELQSDGVRIATVPGKSVIGIEVPNKNVSVVSLRSLLENRDFMNSKSKITVCVGLTVTGKPVYMDIDEMPHVLIAGQTKSGKSVAINCMLLSLLYRTTPDEVQLILIDPKRVELNIYSKVPHLVMPVIDDPQRAAAALRWAVNEMERRYEIMDTLGVRNRDEYYELKEQDPSLEYLPQIVIVIDELADLMLQVKEHVETLINRLAAKARACGIHLLVGTQRPSVDIVTGLIKANIPARISFQVSSGTDSKIVLGAVGAEKLLGRGDMLYQATGAGRVRVQGAFVSSGEIKRVTKFIIDNNGEASFDPEVMRQLDIETDKINKTNKKAMPSGETDSGGTVDGSDVDFEYICKAMEYVLENRIVTTNNIQRHLHIGFNRAADIVDALEDLGFISPRNGSKPRDILIDYESFEQWKLRNAP